MRKTCLLFVICILAIGIAYADTGITVNFPSNTSFFCSATNGCGFMGDNGGQTFSMWTTGDFVTETFFTGQPAVNDLTANWGVIDGYGGNPGALYENDVYVNGVFVGAFLLADCNYCNTLNTVGGTVDFAPIVGDGTYNISIVLAQTAPVGDGAQTFSSLTAEGGPSTTIFSSAVPEPGSLVLLGSGLLGAIGVLRRKLLP